MVLDSIALQLSSEKKTDFAIERFSGAALDVIESFFREPSASHPNGARSLIVAETRPLFASVLAAVDHFFHIWDELCAAGRKGHADEVHEFRERYLTSYENKLRLVQRARQIADNLALVTGEPAPEASTLAKAGDKLADFRSKVFERWQCLDDLEYMIAESFQFSTEKLEAVRKKQEFPWAWYNEDSKPF